MRYNLIYPAFTHSLPCCCLSWTKIYYSWMLLFSHFWYPTSFPLNVGGSVRLYISFCRYLWTHLVLTELKKYFVIEFFSSRCKSVFFSSPMCNLSYNQCKKYKVYYLSRTSVSCNSATGLSIEPDFFIHCLTLGPLTCTVNPGMDTPSKYN